jgi:hypothetical protein
VSARSQSIIEGEEQSMLSTKKKILQSILAASLCLALLFGTAACGNRGDSGGDETPAGAPPPTADPNTEIWSGDLDATYSEEEPDDMGSVNLAPGTMMAGKTVDGKNTFALIRFNIDADLLADEVRNARLFLKVMGKTSPESLRLILVEGSWDAYFSPITEIKSLLDYENSISVEVRKESGGWISMPMTDYAKTWLRGDLYNNGFAIFGETSGETYTFASIAGRDDDDADLPYIAVSGEIGDRALIYGKYSYGEMSMPGEEDDGNCMSYALRDTDMILADDLGLDDEEMARIYTESAAGKSVDALADYTAKSAEAYVKAHRDGLKISKFRRIDDFDSKIDPKNEYRIALRVGVDLIGDEVDFSDEHSFDYHFWVELNDGRWAQKFPSGPSMIVPCTGPDISPGKYPWDSGYMRTAKTADYYTGKTIYFAVTKTTDEFTRHRG